MKESIKLIKNQIRAYNTWLVEFENHTKYNEIKSKRDALESEIELLSNHSVLHSIMHSHPVVHIEIEKSMDQHYIKVGRLSNMKYQVWEDQGNGTYNKEGKEWDTLEKALAYSETLK